MPLTKKVPVLFSPEDYDRLKDLSKRKKKTMGSIIREAVDRTLDAEKGWSTEELLNSRGKLLLDIDLDKVRADRDIN